MTCTGTHTVTQGDLNAGKFDDTACANVTTCADDSVPAEQTHTLTITKTDDTVSYDHVGQIITYTITATNTGNVPQTITVTDTPALDDFSCVPANGSSVLQGASMTCNSGKTHARTPLTPGNRNHTASGNETTYAD